MVDLLCEMRSFEWVLWLRHEVEWSVEAAGLWFGLIQSEIHPREQKKADKKLKRGLFEATVWQRNLITMWQNLYLNMQIPCVNEMGKILSFFKFLYCNFIFTWLTLPVNWSYVALSYLSYNLRCAPPHPNFSGPNFTSGVWISHSQGALFIHHGSESPSRNFFPGSARQNRWEIRTACNEHSPQVISQTRSLLDPLLVAINSQL